MCVLEQFRSLFKVRCQQEDTEGINVRNRARIVWFYSFPAFMMVKGLDEPWGQGREGNCCYGLRSFWKHSVPNGVRSFLLLCLPLSHTDMYIPTCAKVMEHCNVVGACACFLYIAFLDAPESPLDESIKMHAVSLCPFEVPTVSTTAKTYPSVLLFSM